MKTETLFPQTGYGPEGPSAHLPGYDVIISAAGGIMSITGPADGAPCKIGVAMTGTASCYYM